MEDTKQCIKCHQVKPLLVFSKAKNSKDGHFAYCKVCAIAHRRKWFKENKEHSYATKKAYLDAHPEKKKLFQDNDYKRRKANPERWKKQQRAVAKASVIWRRNNPEKVREYCRQRKLRKRLSRQGKISTQRITFNAVFDRDHGICSICLLRVNKKLKWPDPMSGTVDHIVPLACGGEDLWANVVLAHHICNSRKSNYVVPQQMRLF